MINFKHIQAIQAIVREGSVTAASKKLFISQPALSQTVRAVEEELGAPLFERVGGRLSLTQTGKLYMEAAARIQDIDRELHARIEDARGELRGELRLGITAERSPEILYRVLPWFSQMYPGVALRLYEGESPALERMVSEGEVDAAFLCAERKRSRLNYLPIAGGEPVLVAGPSSGIAGRMPQGGTVSLEDVKDEHFVVMSEGHDMRHLLERLAEEAGVTLRIVLETDSVWTALFAAVRCGALFLCPGPVWDLNRQFTGKAVGFALKSASGFPAGFYFCTRQDTYMPRYVKGLLSVVTGRTGEWED